MLDPRGCVRNWNARAQQMFGHRAEAVLGATYTKLVAAPEGDGRAAQVFATADNQGYAEYDATGTRADGTFFPVRTLVTALIEDGRHIGYSVAVLDVTKQDAARQRQGDDNARLLSIIQSAMDAIVTVDEQQKIVLFNRAAEKTFGCSAREAIGGSLDRFIPPRYREAHGRHVERFAATGATTRRMGDQTVLAGLRGDGSEFPLEASISQVTVGGRKLFTVILRDITERQRAGEALARSHSQLQRLYAAMHDVREAERTRIARELHDELAQWLTALRMDASWLAQRLDPTQSQMAAKIEKMKTAVDTTVAAVRRIAADLRPVMLDDLGLMPALENLLHDFSERTGIVVSLEGDVDDVVFREPLASAVYRMVQEALTNVARHAEASAVELSVRRDRERLKVRVTDNGRGIQPADLESRDSYGLLGIRERAQTLGGTASIYAAEGGGTSVDLDIPLETEHSGAQSR